MGANGKKWLTRTAVAAFWLLVWAILSRLVDEVLLLPSPWAVAQALGRLGATADFWRAVGSSLLRIVLGYGAAVVLGTGLAMLTGRFPLLHTLFSPLLHLMRTVPVASFIILAYLWIRLQLLPGCIAGLMVVPLVWGNVSSGIAQTDRQLLEMARTCRLGRWGTLRHIWVPSVKPYFQAACATGMGFAWKSGIAAEVICSPDRAIGTELKTAKVYLETPEVFAWTVTVVLLSVLLERAVLGLLRQRTGAQKKEAGV